MVDTKSKLFFVDVEGFTLYQCASAVINLVDVMMSDIAGFPLFS